MSGSSHHRLSVQNTKPEIATHFDPGSIRDVRTTSGDGWVGGEHHQIHDVSPGQIMTGENEVEGL